MVIGLVLVKVEFKPTVLLLLNCTEVPEQTLFTEVVAELVLSIKPMFTLVGVLMLKQLLAFGPCLTW